MRYILSDLVLQGEETGLDLGAHALRTQTPMYFMTSLPPSHDLHQRATQIAPVIPKPFAGEALSIFLNLERRFMTLPLVTILDDEPAIRSILADALQEAGFRTMGFARATEFEAALKSTTPDVCLVDLGLPDRDGLGLVHRLALEQGAAVIIISGRAQVQDRITGLELGADDYIIKPFDPSEVVARVACAHPENTPPRNSGQHRRFCRFGPRISIAMR